ncbi:MAG: heavy metal translocating P-type ATPase [Candidatus Caldarchaeum sp.]
MAKDPVCGMYVEESEEALKATVRGREYFFCSESCLTSFVAPEAEFQRLKHLTLLSFSLGIPALILMWLPILPTTLNDYVLFALTTPVQFIAGMRFYKGMAHALKAGTANMDTLIAIGTSAAWGYSTLVTFFPHSFPHGTYFEVSALIIAFILLGRVLEHRVRLRASDAVRKLLELRPSMARVLRNGSEVLVPVEDVRVDDIMVVRPGEKIPTDGVILEGHAAIDERMITGESTPVDKTVGEEVIGGTINKTGFIKVKATRTGSDTVLAQIIDLVEKAQAGRAPVERLADKISSYFVPAVVAVALLSLAAWTLAKGTAFPTGFVAFVAVLIVACPCALGLATPAALVVGVGRGAENGVLIKGGEYVEKASGVDTVVFDKTGTLTLGEPTTTDIIPLKEVGEMDVLRFAAAAEKGSEHPLGRAVVEHALKKGLEIPEPKEFSYLPGMGVKAVVGQHTIAVGKIKMLELAAAKTAPVEKVVEGLQSQGKTAIVVIVDGEAVGVLGLADTLKPNAEEVIKKLKTMGLRIMMLTGDNERTARTIAKQAGIDDVVAEVLPAQKAEAIKKLMEQGRRVAMVGDGVNDAPALATADIGIALGSGTDVAVESAGIVLLSDDLRKVATAISLSRHTMRKIKQNLFWAFIYNTVLIPVAAIGILNPILAAAAMALSSVSVLTNSLSLKTIKL